MISDVHHLGREDAGGAVKGGEGFIELSHVPTDGWFAFYHIDMVTCIGNLKRSLDAGNTTTDYQGIRMNGYFEWDERLMPDNAFHAT